MLLMLTLAGGCRTIVVPPSQPVDPVDVVLVDYGRHASLGLPRGENTFVEYAYGDWRWFALGRNRWYDSFTTILVPTRGTLGRHTLARHADREPADEWDESLRTITFQVSAGDAQRLLTELDERYAANAGTEIHNAENGLTFVHDDMAFHAFNTCNHEVARWLRALGCDVRSPPSPGAYEFRPVVPAATRPKAVSDDPPP